MRGNRSSSLKVSLLMVESSTPRADSSDACSTCSNISLLASAGLAANSLEFPLSTPTGAADGLSVSTRKPSSQPIASWCAVRVAIDRWRRAQARGGPTMAGERAFHPSTSTGTSEGLTACCSAGCFTHSTFLASRLFRAQQKQKMAIKTSANVVSPPATDAIMYTSIESSSAEAATTSLKSGRYGGRRGGSEGGG